MKPIPWSWETMPLSTAVIFAVALFLVLILLFLAWDKWRNNSELRAIRRRKRRERKILARSRALITAREIAKRRVECSVRTSRAFMRAFRETHEVQR
jgi:hypothetical protein